MELDVIQRRIFNTEDVAELQQIQLDMERHISGLHKQLATKDTEKRKDIIMELNISIKLKRFAEEREPVLRKQVHSFNHKFVLAAKYMLTEETYNKIAEQAKGYSADIKNSRKELKQLKLDK